ncbi:T9SS type A sorting domain-containing protein [Neolewinella agarilytica]|uniref:Por secretion system C-terminal sorting domain-containing protein n=1 Tax=Neolewinella agarilytica TaxID=478744 RepID=A0A1H9EC09_9BACT|nr:T9SS type A sorting domain-containing protein [Neolewinella agarilytica]SEQ23082.1 Por secretion system C-terminal sorting domain-containing protein [Neolewinella agarilytica]
MKFALSTTFSLLLLLWAVPSFAQTNVEGSYPVDYISDINDIHIDDSGLGYLGGTCGVLRKTTDNGATWTVEDSPTDNDIISLACPPGGCGTRLLATDDQLFRLARNRWTEVTYANYNDGGELHWLTDDLVIHEAGSAGFYRSTDGGINWTEGQFGANKDSNISFPTSQTGYLVADEKVLKTTDGGASFTATGYTHPVRVFHINFLNENDGWLWGTDDLFYRTSDGGVSWTQLNAEVQLTSLRWFTPLSATRLVANQGITLAESNDGGVTWTRGQYDIQNVRSVGRKYHRSGDSFFLPGDQNQLLYSASNFMDFIRLDDYERSGDYIGIAFSDAQTGYAIAGNVLLSTTDAGVSWTKQSTGTVARNLAIIDGAPIILFDNNTVTTSDFGVNYTDYFPVGLVPEGEFPDVVEYKPNGNIYFFGRNYAYESTDNGQTYTAIQHNQDMFATTLFWFDDNNGYVLDRNRKYAFTTDGGQSWTQGPQFPGFSPTDIFFTSEEEGFAHNFSTRYLTTDRGQTWSRASDNFGGYSFQHRQGDDNIFGIRADGATNTVIRSQDNGGNWSSLTSGNCFLPKAGTITPDGSYLFVAGAGFIVRHDMEEIISSTPRRELPAALALKAYPNPTSDVVIIDVPLSVSSSTISVYDGNGRELKEQSVTLGFTQTSVSLDGLPQGIYLIRWVADDGRSGRVRVVKSGK